MRHLFLGIRHVMRFNILNYIHYSQERKKNFNPGKRLQFPVKWNAFSDRNGMLFSGLTEWLSDTNGMAQ